MSYLNTTVVAPALDSTTWVWISSFTVAFYSKPYLTLTPSITSMFLGDTKTFTIASHDLYPAPKEFNWTANIAGTAVTINQTSSTSCSFTPTTAGKAIVTATGIAGGISFSKNISFMVIEPASSIANAKENYSTGIAVRATGIVYAKYTDGFFFADSDGVGMYVSPSDGFDISSLAIGDKICVDGTYANNLGQIAISVVFSFGNYINNATLNSTVSTGNEVSSISLSDETINSFNPGNNLITPYLENKFSGSGKLSQKLITSTPSSSTYFDSYLTSGGAAHIGVILNPNSNCYNQSDLDNYILERDSYTLDSSVVTLTGPLVYTINATLIGMSENNYRIGTQPITDSTYYSEASLYSKNFLSATSAFDPVGAAEASVTLWSELSSKYSSLSDSAKNDLRNATASASGSLTAKFAERYDYIVATYLYNNFVNR